MDQPGQHDGLTAGMVQGLLAMALVGGMIGRLGNVYLLSVYNIFVINKYRIIFLSDNFQLAKA